jgi:hypothetical protein
MSTKKKKNEFTKGKGDYIVHIEYSYLFKFLVVLHAQTIEEQKNSTMNEMNLARKNKENQDGHLDLVEIGKNRKRGQRKKMQKATTLISCWRETATPYSRHARSGE